MKILKIVLSALPLSTLTDAKYTLNLTLQIISDGSETFVMQLIENQSFEFSFAPLKGFEISHPCPFINRHIRYNTWGQFCDRVAPKAIFDRERSLGRKIPLHNPFDFIVTD